MAYSACKFKCDVKVKLRGIDIHLSKNKLQRLEEKQLYLHMMSCILNSGLQRSRVECCGTFSNTRVTLNLLLTCDCHANLETFIYD